MHTDRLKQLTDFLCQLLDCWVVLNDQLTVQELFDRDLRLCAFGEFFVCFDNPFGIRISEYNVISSPGDVVSMISEQIGDERTQ